MSRRIVAIGGGGFLMDDSRGLQERYLLRQCRPTPGRRPRVLYLGTASGDSEHAQLRFFKMFASLGCEADTLVFFPFDMRRDYAAAARWADLIYVGGGNTVAMLTVWREFGFDRALRAAYEAGSVLAGISAGANCWFERYITDSVPGGGVQSGLGILPGTFCPHLDSESWRQALLDASTGPAVGAGENVYVLYEDEHWLEAVHDRPAQHREPALCRARHSVGGPLQAITPILLTENSAPVATAFPVPTLQGTRCLLRTMTVADAPSLRQQADDAAVWRNLFEGFPHPYTLADAQGWCNPESRPQSMGFVWGIEVQGDVVGCISVRPDVGWLRCNAEVGYWIGQAYWRRGIVSEALSLVTAWVWQALPEVTRLYAPIFAWNQGSQGVARNSGYIKEADLARSAIKNGQVIDRVQWACVRPAAPDGASN